MGECQHLPAHNRGKACAACLRQCRARVAELTARQLPEEETARHALRWKERAEEAEARVEELEGERVDAVGREHMIGLNKRDIQRTRAEQAEAERDQLRETIAAIAAAMDAYPDSDLVSLARHANKATAEQADQLREENRRLREERDSWRDAAESGEEGWPDCDGDNHRPWCRTARKAAGGP